jgi:DNA-binding LacI/PurR family transcriptional regulator
MRTTIKDVARLAQVSQATVSLVLNDAPGVSDDTRARIRGIMTELNYRPDALARSFSSRRAEAIALVLPPGFDSLYDPYFMSLLRGTLEAVRDRGYKMLLEIADDRFIAQGLWEDMFARKRIDGLVVATPYLDQAYLEPLAECGYPALLLNGARPDLPSLDYMGFDDIRCGFDATYYLIGLGHRRIGFLSGPENQASALGRHEGYRQALARARIPYREEDILGGDYRAEQAETSIRSWIPRSVSDRPTALFCANDTMAITAMTVLRDAGWDIPEDLSLIGVDDTGAAAVATPALTTMRQDIPLLARQATARFLKKLDERETGTVHELLPMTLIERASCSPPGVRS